MMKRTIFMLLCGLVLAISSCKNGEKSTAVETTKTDPAAEGYVKGTMSDYSSLDGCGWLIKLEDATAESSVQIINPTDDLPAEYKNDGKTVWVKYKVSDMMSTCMKGHMAKVEGIKPR